ncbi:forkhead box protein C2-like [Asterias rubens]|uniref:forkhead box protein C2-like n=1 Tax=Asterias rubens TaxID=7604 RepID=UPI001455B5B9|nr:forkhead box protein C2-like [Asterias rubens]
MFSSCSTREADSGVTDMSTIQSILDSFANSPPMTVSTSTAPVQPNCELDEVAQPTTLDDDDSRPKHSYLALTTMALQHQPGKQCDLKAIYEYITAAFPYYTKNRKHWKNSVRHNLTLHKCFKRLDTEEDRIREAKGNLRSNPRWALVSVPDSSKLLIPRQIRDRTSGAKKRKSKNSPADEKSRSHKEPKTKTKKHEINSPTAALSTVSPLASISLMLPKIGSNDSCLPSTSTTLRALLQPPVTPESDYGSLCSDRSSPFIPEHSFSEHHALQSQSPGLPDDGLSPLPRLSVQDICAVLHDDFPGSPDSGAGTDLLDGFGWLDDSEPANQGTPDEQFFYPQPCLADTLLDDSVFEPAAVSYFVPKVPVEHPLSVSIQNFTF